MSRLPFAARVFCALLAYSAPSLAADGASRTISLPQALQRALAANPRLTAAERDIGIAGGLRIQAGALPNPEASFELDNAFGSGPYKGVRSAETNLQLSQLVELGGKREARVAAGEAGIGTAVWQRRATRLEVLSETAIAFITIISAQRRIEIFDEQIASFDPLIPLLQKRVQEGASSPAETLRAQVAADLFRVERERSKTLLATARRDLAILMGDASPRFGEAVGRLATTGQPPPFKAVLQAIDANPQLARWTAVTAQRNAELLIARLKAIPDPRISAGWRHFQDTNDNAVRLGVSIPLPVFDQNTGNIIAAQETLAKTDAERAINKLVLLSIAGRAYDALTGALAELKLLRSSVIPNARSAAETILSGYSQGRFTLLELLDVRGALLQALLREQEALQNFHIAVATIEGLIGNPFSLTRESSR
ncbi:TolC family protein [Bradyrhizobium sp. INPA01-394B]|jgi:cobalt-zinc-cadmium efflux system outer membrane protein|uniref:TolC family protein n=3 Tax=Bradyrhizobium TaxID=374 RepID=A0ABR7UKU3_9BRAD|nr:MULTISPECIES: TolC family protein [Bradyrhizobium]MBC9879968.1 TolC family protein [Bradyrhizobium campsiandrae]MBC9984559.1 TolC family protein [Bradyrhizobium campsiandrae]MDU1498021.1 TolC family protein [Bradyrhizobium sp.]MDU1548282.1 TolC family protein [Bradyrhizobium sp.]MDU1667037.1 TolC family protein [Bradyrhizobium sp.]